MSAYSRNLIVTILGLATAGPLLGGPTISSFSPGYAAYGDPNYVFIYGSGFINTPENLVVEFNGVQDPTAQPVSATEIQAYVPAAAPVGPGPIMVSVNGVACYSLQDFVVVGPGPYVSGFTPFIGSDGAQVVLTGEHFTDVTNVSFNGLPGINLFVGFDSSLQVDAPPGVTSGPITVVSPEGSFTTQSNFFVPPVVTGFSPAAGRAGTNVILSGSNLAGALAVLINGLPASFIATNNSSLSVTVPPNATTGPIRLNAPAGAFITTSNFLILPTLAAFSPASGPVSTPVTIVGANLNVGTPVVIIGGVNAVVQSASFSQLTALVPAGATTGPITVTTRDGAATSSTRFYLPPSITAVSPRSGLPSTWVKISGVNFTDASAVSFNAQPADRFAVTNNTTLGAAVPAGVTSGPISVVTPGGTAVAASNLWFYAAPSISSFSPFHGLPGTNVLITGLNFVGVTNVFFNGKPASAFSAASSTTLSATVPTNATTGPISVAGPAATAVSASSFVIDSSDLALSVVAAPDPVHVGSNLVYTITVLNHGPYLAPNVVVGDIPPALTNLVSATATQGSFTTNMGHLLCGLGPIDVDASARLTLVNTAPLLPGTLTNYASVSADDADPVSTNNVVITLTRVVLPPELSIDLLSNRLVQVWWPAALTNYHLQFNSALGAGVIWSNDTTLPALSNSVSSSFRVVTETNSNPARFYRLSQ
jgi:large repetitive protein